MNRSIVTLAMLLWLALPALAHTVHWQTRNPELAVVDESGQPLPVYPASRAPTAVHGYVRAHRGLRYRLRVHNPRSVRVGVVIAVDGRNVVSGRHSELASGEAMYVLAPFETRVIDGWRGSLEQVNAFYFTGAADSYAAAWSDVSAPGVIAMAVFAEAPARYRRESAPAAVAPGTDKRRDAAGAGESGLRSAPGTGYGALLWSPARHVVFEAGNHPLVRYMLRYAWPETLCELGISRCEAGPGAGDRWQPGGFAPPPPRW